jgi:uncharacterized repeat protein (TIGR01451 family)
MVLRSIRVIFPVVLFIAAVPIAAQTTVQPADLSGWVIQNATCGAASTGSTSFVTGPATPPLGDGSFQVDIGANGDSFVGVRTPEFNGVLLSSLTSLSYSTFVQAFGSGGQAPYVLLNVDYDGDTVTDDQLFFEPVYQTAVFFPSNPQGPVALATWQTWDALNGGWWSVSGTAGATPGAGVKSLATIIAAQPTARLTPGATGSLRVMNGCGGAAWANFIGNIDNVTVGVSSVNETFDFEPTPSIIIDDVTQVEGTGGTTNFVFNLTLSEAVSQTVTVDYTTADGTATAADPDYTPVTVPATATFTPGSTATTLTIVVTADNKLELDETFFVNLVNPQFATIADPQAQGTIQNDDAQPTISFTSDVAMPEGSGGGTTTFPFNVVLSNPSYLPITVDYTTNPGTATEGTDYTDATGTLTFVPGDTAEVINVGVAADTGFEPDETFTVDLSAPTNATISDPSSLGTIQNDDAVPAATINDVAQTETNGATNFVFTVTLGSTSTQTVTINYTTNPGTATEGVDYTDATGTLTFLPGDTSETITVPVIGDINFESDETFFVDLSVPVNATISDNQGQGTIQNDDAVPAATINDVAQTETNGATNFVFTVTLGTTSTSTVTIAYTTNPGTATEGVDYTDATGTLTFLPGDTSEQITVVVNGDTAFEGDETFFVDLSAPVNATLSDNQGQGTIQNDDALPQILINDVTQAEGTGGTTNFVFAVTLTNPSGSNVTVNYTTTPGTAAEGVDYTDATGTVTFLPGDVSETITVVVTADNSFEPDETFFVDLSGATGSTILDNQGLGTIQNDDGPMADLTITKVGPAVAPPDQNVTYTITVTNAGPDTASNVVVTDVLPAGSTFVSATPTQGSCTGTTTVTCNLGAMNNGATATITLVVDPPLAGTLANTASVTNTPEVDPTPANNAGTALTAIGSSDIPTLSQWALMALVSALLALAVFKLK